MQGPSFEGLYGRRAGTAPGYKYSSVMSSYGEVWDEHALMDFLLRPNVDTVHPPMLFKTAKLGLGDLRKHDVRRDLVAFLKTATAAPQQR